MTAIEKALFKVFVFTIIAAVDVMILMLATVELAYLYIKNEAVTFVLAAIALYVLVQSFAWVTISLFKDFKITKKVAYATHVISAAVVSLWVYLEINPTNWIATSVVVALTGISILLRPWVFGEISKIVLKQP